MNKVILLVAIIALMAVGIAYAISPGYTDRFETMQEMHVRLMNGGYTPERTNLQRIYMKNTGLREKMGDMHSSYIRGYNLPETNQMDGMLQSCHA